MTPVPFGELHTPGGYLVGEVASALQKCVRRGETDDALFWATELDLAGFGGYVFKRAKIMASEDVGLADPMAAVLVATLHANWVEARKNKEDKSGYERLFLLHAVAYLAKTQHSRMMDNALMVMYEGERPHREVPDHALDKHTRAGRMMGRGHEHFFKDGAQLANVPGWLPDPYAESGPAARMSKGKRRAPLVLE